MRRNPPVPPFKKGGRRGDLQWPFQKAKFMQYSESCFEMDSIISIRLAIYSLCALCASVVKSR
jgi:hypothetical protein